MGSKIYTKLLGIKKKTIRFEVHVRVKKRRLKRNTVRKEKENPSRSVSRFGSMQKFRSHPLIHTPLEFNLAQNAVGGQFNAVGKITPSRPSLNG
jgi:hypothetical protein